MTKHLDSHAQTAYGDLINRCLTPAFDGTGVSFTWKKVKDRKYWYVNLKLGLTPVQRYLGPDNEDTERLIAKEKELWSLRESDRQERARLVNLFLVAGGMELTRHEAKILTVLERSGVFLAGGVLVGTPAFRAIGNNLGVHWSANTRTKDIDLASDYRYPIVLPNQPIDLRQILSETEMGFIEIPTLNAKNPSTSFKLQKHDFVIDVLTPELGPPAAGPVHLKSFNTYAKPLRYLDYLLAEVEPAVFPFGIGIMVNVPNPARFAIHKLAISQRRRADERIKSKKDIDQASELLQVIFEQQPGMVMIAFEAAEKMGDKFVKYVREGLSLCNSELQSQWAEWVG